MGVNIGCMLLRPTDATKHFLNAWLDRLLTEHGWDQSTFSGVQPALNSGAHHVTQQQHSIKRRLEVQ